MNQECGMPVDGALEACPGCGKLLTSFDSDSLELNASEPSSVGTDVSSALVSRIGRVRKLLEVKLADPKQPTQVLMRALSSLNNAEELIGKKQHVEAERMVVETEAIIAPSVPKKSSEKPPERPRRRRIIIGPAVGVFLMVAD